MPFYEFVGRMVASAIVTATVVASLFEVAIGAWR